MSPPTCRIGNAQLRSVWLVQSSDANTFTHMALHSRPLRWRALTCSRKIQRDGLVVLPLFKPLTGHGPIVPSGRVEQPSAVA